MAIDLRKLKGKMGAEVRRLRLEKKLTHQELAAKSGISYKHMFNIESGEALPSMTVYIALCRALGVERVPLMG